MKYINAADILPEELVEEISKYADGVMLYVPSIREKQPWGKVSGSRRFYEDRNQQIVNLFEKGISIKDLACDFGLSYEAIRKIIKNKE